MENTVTEDVPFSFPEYIILEQWDVHNLYHSVNNYIKQGFELVGAPFTKTVYTYQNTWDNGVQKYVDREIKTVSICQAMIKKMRNPFERTIKVTQQPSENPF